DWNIWLLMAGRGFGKTKTGTEFIRQCVKDGHKHLIIAGRTAADVRATLVLGPSGIATVSPRSEGLRYKPSESCIVWPNGAKALLLSADEPDQFRGPQCSAFLADEAAAWPKKEAWDNLMFGFRLGRKPRGIVTTTPRRNELMMELLGRSDVHVTTGSTYENALNLAKPFLEKIVTMYEGTRIGRQELHAEVLPDAGELWSRVDMIDAHRVALQPPLKRIVVGVDPAVTSGVASDETGIVVAGIGLDNHIYVLADESGKFSPMQWGARVVAAYEKHGCDTIVAEANNGGDLVEENLRNAACGALARVKLVHASRGKQTRAEPIVALYEQGRVHHVGSHPLLEDQMVGWSPSTDRKSPDRVDALVWACTELVGDAIKPPPSYGGCTVGSRSF
ncbi:MAG: ATP-binding protein, partial [Chloroflexia bacterium]|nr:ATP-binding protein [Chloroflexia bacterium]